MTTAEQFSLSHGQLLPLLHGLYFANDEISQSKITSRFKNLQKVGVPLGDRPARGKRQKYNLLQVCEIVVSFELSELGLDPRTIATRYLTSQAGYIWCTILRDVVSVTLSGRKAMDVVLPFYINAISDNTEKHKVMPLIMIDQNKDVFSVGQVLGGKRRACLLDLTRIARDLVDMLPSSMR